MDKDSKGQRQLQDSDGGLLLAVEGHSLEQNRKEQNTIEQNRTEHNGIE